MDTLSEKERRELEGVHPALVAVVERAFDLTTADYMVFDGLRTKAEQRQMVRRGASKTMNSYHLRQADGWGHAVDIVVEVGGKPQWPNDRRAWADINRAMKQAASELKVPVKNGYDMWGWDHPHWQIPRKMSWRNTPNNPVEVPKGLIGNADHFREVLPYVLRHEGGYVNDRYDPGGATNRGITIHTLRRWRKCKVTARDVRELSMTETQAIYEALYWDVLRLDDMPKGCDYPMFSCGVLAGTGTAARICQRIVGADIDGRIGRATIHMLTDYVRDHGKDIFITRFCAGWLAYLKGRRGWKRYGRGWGRRIEEVREVALVMAERDKVPDFDRPIKPAPQLSLWSALAEFINSILRETYR